MKNKYFLLFVVLLPLFFLNCKKTTQSKVQANGLTVDINKLIPDTTLTKIKNLGMPINTGATPPNITNMYLASPFILKNSNVANDTPERSFQILK